ncbi:hypothetical protein BW723_12280 [Polaribacter reichenbachii]|uniref:Uncharacterized protein n=1 Tax=Polaribacter reichenbachii TaxID=996801 RepID=A0A1B8TPC0_9FLAO|nr:hypothetical protein [Polaribacter reichenbachii]APZ47011.1 hypothetical protein BW723_12280 [Polaribacter reichenbachii]AUC17653.1 hypothetical protein BTO17_02730 [Polaribacter reichenbachii]OBY61473.1 hypothetical protein LPB301_15495 [Polaribacter reichenbachii]
MTKEDILGDFSIIGSNQNESEETYKGVLSLTLDDENRIIAKWIINKSQEQFGVGFFKNNTLVVNFNYQGDENNTYYGTVVYKCLNKDILEGFWSEEYGDPKFLGTENCFRIKGSKTVLN